MKNPRTTLFSADWLQDFKTAFGMEGLVALTYWIATLFAKKERSRVGRFPFLLINGEPGTGKTELASLLQKMFSAGDIRYTDRCTLPGLLRVIKSAQGIPVLSEGFARYYCDQLVGLYEGAIPVTGTSRGSVSAEEFYGSLVILLNPEETIPKTFIARSVAITLDRSRFSEAGRDAVQRLNKRVDAFPGPIHDVGVAATLRQDLIYERFNGMVADCEATLLEAGAAPRDALNHSQLMAFARCLPLVLSVDAETVDAIVAVIVKSALDRKTKEQVVK